MVKKTHIQTSKSFDLDPAEDTPPYTRSPCQSVIVACLCYDDDDDAVSFLRGASDLRTPPGAGAGGGALGFNVGRGCGGGVYNKTWGAQPLALQPCHYSLPLYYCRLSTVVDRSHVSRKHHPPRPCTTLAAANNK